MQIPLSYVPAGPPSQTSNKYHAGIMLVELELPT